MPGAIQKNSIVQQIIPRILEYITDNNLSIGDKLPTEREMAAMWNVSRSSLRSAVQLLIYNSVLSVRQGSGIYLKELPEFFLKKQNEEDIDKLKMFEDKLEARMALECEAIKIAAIRRDNSDLTEIGSILEEMRSCVADNTMQRYSILDLNFHSCLIRATKNIQLYKMAQVLWEELPEWFLGYGKIPKLEEESLAQHERIFEAVRDKNPELASRLMAEHIAYATTTNKILQQE